MTVTGQGLAGDIVNITGKISGKPTPCTLVQVMTRSCSWAMTSFDDAATSRVNSLTQFAIIDYAFKLVVCVGGDRRPEV